MSKNTLALALKYYLHTFELISWGPRALLLFHKIHCGAVSREKGKYTTPAHSSKTTKSSPDLQWCPEEFLFPTNFSTLEWSVSYFGLSVICRDDTKYFD